MFWALFTLVLVVLPSLACVAVYAANHVDESCNHSLNPFD